MFQRCNCADSFNLRPGLGDGPSDVYDDSYCYDFHARGIPLEDAGNRCNRIYEELNALAIIPAAAINAAPDMPIEWHLEQLQYAENLRNAGFRFDDSSAPAYLAPYVGEPIQSPASPPVFESLPAPMPVPVFASMPAPEPAPLFDLPGDGNWERFLNSTAAQPIREAAFDPQAMQRDWAGPVFVPPAPAPAPAPSFAPLPVVDSVRAPVFTAITSPAPAPAPSFAPLPVVDSVRAPVFTAITSPAPVVTAPSSPAVNQTSAVQPFVPLAPGAAPTGGGRAVASSQVAPPTFDAWGEPLPAWTGQPTTSVQALDATESPKAAGIGVGGLLTLAALAATLFQS